MKNNKFLIILLLAATISSCRLRPSEPSSSSSNDDILSSSESQTSKSSESELITSTTSVEDSEKDTTTTTERTNGTTSEDRETTSETTNTSLSEPLPEFIVTFVTNADTTLEPIETSKLEAPPSITNAPLVLEAWYFEANFQNVVSFPLLVTKDITLYANWVESSEGINYRINAASNGYIVESYTGNAYDVVIPNYYAGLPVVEIGAYLFYEQGNILSVTLPETITTINYAAFKSATSLTSIALPRDLITIGNDAFSGATSLTSINFTAPSLEIIGNNAFEKTAINNVVLPATVTSIGSRAFADNSSLTTLSLLAMTPPTVYPNTFDKTAENLQIKVPATALNAYENNTYWASYADKLKTI